MILPFVANTDHAWFDFLGDGDRRVIDEVNFWQPKARRPMKEMTPGEPVFFRLKAPRSAIAGYGFFGHFRLLSLADAWSTFEWKNGDPNKLRFLDRIGGYRREDLLRPGAERAQMACTILRDATFWPPSRWIPWGEQEGWQPTIVQGKTERDPQRAGRLMAEIAAANHDAPGEFWEQFTLVQGDYRKVVESTAVRRDGQGTFRLRLLDAYERQCAITGEHTEVVLDAAHIQPYLGPASNHVQNGLLLTKEFHKLFDQGYVTVTPDYQVRVSGRLREDWDNGRRYYPYDGEQLRRVPQSSATRPSRDALAWHGEHVFMGQ